MSKRTVLLFLSLLASAFLSSCGYNTLVASDEGVKAAWSQVQNQYQRRSDLIPNLVETVKAAGAYEKGALQAVVEARSKAGGVMQLSPDAVNDPATMKKFSEAQNNLGSVLQRLLVINEQYPTLQAVAGYRDLQAQIEGTENRISVERMRYNDAVKNHNTMVRSFPNNLIAGLFNFKPAVFFEMGEEARKAPRVQF